MHASKDIIPAVDYHDENLVIRHFNDSTVYSFIRGTKADFSRGIRISREILVAD